MAKHPPPLDAGHILTRLCQLIYRLELLVQGIGDFVMRRYVPAGLTLVLLFATPGAMAVLANPTHIDLTPPPANPPNLDKYLDGFPIDCIHPSDGGSSGASMKCYACTNSGSGGDSYGNLPISQEGSGRGIGFSLEYEYARGWGPYSRIMISLQGSCGDD